MEEERSRWRRRVPVVFAAVLLAGAAFATSGLSDRLTLPPPPDPDTALPSAPDGDADGPPERPDRVPQAADGAAPAASDDPTPSPDEAAEAFAGLLALLFDAGADVEAVLEAAVAAAADAAGDPYASLLWPDEATRYGGQLEGTTGGVGLALSPDDTQVRVVGVIADSPAAQAGLQPDDVLVRIDGQPVDADAQQAGAQLRGAEGSTVDVTVRRAGDLHTVSMQRARVPVPTVRAAGQVDGAAVVEVSRFSGQTATELVDVLGGLDGRPLILDLRGNTGGVLDGAVDTVGVLLGGTEVAQVVDYRDGSQRTWRSSGPAALPADTPLAVVVDARTASASEIVAAALSEQRSVPVVGVDTAGKGTVQQVRPTAGGFMAIATVSSYRTASGRDLDGVGVPVDIVVEDVGDPLAAAAAALQGR